MTTGKPPEKNVIFTEEEADAARARLRAWFSRQESSSKQDSPQADDGDADAAHIEQSDDDESNECDEDEQEEDIQDLFPFKPSERPLIEQIERTIRRHMLAADPASLKDIAAFLHALRRLPYATPDVSLDLALMTRIDENLSYVSVELDDQSFRLSTGGSVYSPDVGSDSYSSTTVEIELGGFREGTTQDFEDWLDQFVSAGGGIEIQGDCDVDLTEGAPDDGWDRLDRYWESRWEDDDGY